MFKIRTTKPTKGNKFYITLSSGGWNNCIKGYPTDPDCDVLSNCVGYACGRFSEIDAEVTKYVGMRYPNLNCNAENFPEKAKKLYGLETQKDPVVGGILVWQNGTLASGDGAGHVEVVEEILERDKNGHPTKVYISGSSYGGAKFFNATRTNANGRWGMAKGYTYRGCIVNPNVKEEPKPEVTQNVKRDTTKDQIQVVVTELRVRMEPSLKGTIIGFATQGYYNYFETKTADGYTWYRIAENQWIAYNKEWEKVLPKATPKPVTKFKVGDKVVITKTGYSNAYGRNGYTAGGIGWTREVLRIWDGKAYPYQIGVASGAYKGTTGYYKADALKKK